MLKNNILAAFVARRELDKEIEDTNKNVALARDCGFIFAWQDWICPTTAAWSRLWVELSPAQRGYKGMNRSRVHILYSGRVQGVGFRYTARTLAAGFEVTGIIRNLADGRVELVAEGSREELTAFQQAILDSGLGHFITHEQVTWAEATGEYRGFVIVSECC